MNSSIDRLHVLLAGAFLVSAALPATAGAQQNDVDQTQEPRFSESFRPAGTQQEVELRVEPTVSRDDFEVHISSEDDDAGTLLHEQLPRWVGEEHYGFTVVTEQLEGGISSVILAALPDIHGDGPPSATQFQVVWLVDERSGRLRWSRLDTAQYSSLDGGERFEFREAGDVHQIVRRQRGEDSIFCGDSANDPVLFDVYDPGDESFEQKLDIDRLVGDASTLAAVPGSDEFEPPTMEAWYQWFAASSDRRTPNRRGALIRPLELGDRKADTGWMEGVEGLGRGEFVSAQINDAVALSSLRIVPGVGGDRQLFEAFARPRRLLVGLSDGSRFVVEVGDVDYEQVESGRGVIVELPEPVKTRCLSVMLLDAERGQAVSGQPAWTRDTTLIAEITPFSELHAADAPKTARRIVEAIAGEEDARARQRITELALTFQDQLADEVRRMIDRSSAEERRRVIPLMAILPAEEAVPLLVEFFGDTDPSSPEYRAVKRTLAAHYAAAAPALIEFLADETPGERKRTDVLRLLGRVGQPSHLTRLIEYLGRGGRAVRNERIRAIGAGGQPLVEALLVHARRNTNTEAGYDALRALNLLGKRLHYNGQGELPRPELLGRALDDIKQRRALMRAFEVAKFFHDPNYVDATREKFSRHDDPLIRRAAIAALERYPSEEARDLLVAALSDKSPDVRISAVSAIAQRDDAREVVDEVVAYAETESWKPGLQQAFRVLADVDNETTTAAFEERFRDEPNAEASLWAAQALDRAHRPVGAGLAQSLVEDLDVQLKLRLEMVDLLGLDTSDEGERFLLDAVDERRWREFSEATREQDQFRDRIILSLGRRRSETGMPVVLEMARNDESADTRQVALRALAFYRDEELLAELEAWRDNVDPDLKNVLEQTINMIERRQAFDSVESDIDEVLEKEREFESNGGDGASNESGPMGIE